MPDQYDEFLERARLAKETREGSLTTTGGDPYDSFIDNVTRAKRVNLESSLNHGSKQDPDAKARALTLAKHLQLPVETIEANPENAARLARLGALDIDALRLESPATAAWLENPNNAAIAHDDIDGLRQIERTARRLTPGEPEPDTPELRAAIETQADRIWETLNEYRNRPVPAAPATGAVQDGGPVSEEELNDPVRQLAQDFGPVENREQVIDVLRRSLRLPSLLPQEGLARAGLRSLESGIVRMAGGLTGSSDLIDNANAMDEQSARRYAPATFGEKVAGGVGGSIPAVAAVALSRGRVAGAATSTAARTLRPDQIASLSKWLVPGEIAGLSLAQNVQDRNQSPAEAILNAVLEGAFTRAGGSFEPFLDAAGATSGKLAKEIGKETLEEGATSGSQDVVSQLLGKDTKPYSFLRTLEAAGVGAAAGSIFAGAYGIPRAMADRYTKQANEAGAAQDHADTVKELVDLVASNKTGQRAPEEVATLVEQMLGQSSRFLFVDSDAFRDAFADPAAAAKLLGVGEEYALALPARGQVQIPTARLVQVAAKNEAFKALLDRYRRTPTSSSAMEAAEFEVKSPDALRQLQAEAKAAAAEATKPDENRRQVSEIEDELFRRMNEVHPPNVDRGALRDVAKALASNFGALSQRTGKAPSELFKVKLKGDMQRVMRGDKFDLMDAMIERLRKGEMPTDREAHGPSLVDFLRDKGLANKVLSGELASLKESDRTRKPGERSLVRDDGIDLDTAAMYAAEAGYIAEATPNALLTALDDEIRGGSPTFSEKKGGNPQAQGIRESLAMLEDAIREAGADIGMSNKEIRAKLADLEDRQGGQGYGQDDATMGAPKIEWVNVPDMGLKAPFYGRFYRGDADEREAGRWWTSDISHARYFGKVRTATIDKDAGWSALYLDAERHPDLQGENGLLDGYEADEALEKILSKTSADVVVVRNWEGAGDVVLSSNPIDDDEDVNFGQSAATVTAPKSNRLDFDALLRQWRKATGDRTPIGGMESWQQLVEESAKVDEANGVELNQPAYHGTPHKFDKFTTDHMGTGTGHQDYGWGLYFTGDKSIGEYYKRMSGGSGNLYKAEIPEDSELIAWQKPLRDQPPVVRAAVESAIKTMAEDMGQFGDESQLDMHLVGDAKGEPGNWTGWQIYRTLSSYLNSKKDDRSKGGDREASLWLNGKGVKGITYKAESGATNYVIFDGADAVITEYNQPGGKNKRRGSVKFTQGAGLGRPFLVNIFSGADVSTMLHEVGGHVMLEMLGDLASEPNAPKEIVDDYRTIRDWFGKNAKDIREQAIELEQDDKGRADVVDALRKATDEDIAKIADNFRSTPTEPAAARLYEAMHEYFARGQEAYIMEGKAPTPAMRGVFARLAEWLKVLYRAAKNLRVNMSPEIVAVFDRLVAADDAVEEAEREAGIDVMLPRETFDTLEEWEKHQKSVAESRADARARTSTRLLAELNRESTRAWKAKRVEVETEVERAVNEAPVYQAIAALQNGTTPDGVRLTDEYQGLKLDRADLVNQWGEEVLKRLPGPENVSTNKANRGASMYAEEGGLPVDQVARMWGFPSGDALIEAMIQADDRASVIRAETDKRMKELNPDPMTDGTLMDQAHAALATDKRAELLRAELNALGRRTGQTPAPIEVLRELARDRIAKVRGYDLAPDKFRVASAKAGRRVVDAAARKDWNEAYRSKLQEILNLELYRAARDAKEAGEAGRTYLRRFDTLAKRQWLGKLGTSGVGQWVVFDVDGAEVGAFDTMEQARAVWQQQPTGAEYRRTNGYMEQVFGILDGYSLRGVSNRQLRRKEQFRKWIARSRDAGEEPIIEEHVIDDLGERSWNDLTVAEQADVVNAVRNIETRAKLKDKLLKAAKEREMDAARAAITSSIVTNQPKPLQDEQSSGPLTTLADAPLRFIDAARKDSHLAYAMDGYQDGGAVWEYFIWPRNEATTESELVHIQEAEAYRQLFKKWGKSKGMAATAIKGTTLKLRLEERIMLAAHWGNAEGRDRVSKRLRMTGHGLPDALAVIDSLDASDWELINGMSRLVNRHWSDVAALEQRVTGIAPEKVQALPIVTAKHGTQPGGYFPLKYDERLSKKAGDLAAEMAARENARAVGARAQTRHGHTNLRAREIEGLAVRLDFGMVAEHLAEVVHDLSHREMLLDQNKLLRDETIKDAVISRHGRRAYRELIDTAGSIANRGRTAGGALSPYAASLRRGVSASVFTYQLTSALMNLTGFLNSLSRVGPLRLLGALGRVGMDAASMTSTMAWVDSKSGLMKARGGNVIREVGEVMREIGPGGKLQSFIRAGYWPMRQVQRVVDTVTWVGAYEQSMAEQVKSGLPFDQAEARAIAIADQIVTDTQGSARVGDLSAIERDGELSKMFTLFFGWMNTTQNITRTQVGRIIRNPTDPATLIGASAVILMTGPVQVVMTDLIRAILRGDDRDEEERLQRFARQQAGFLLGQYILARELSGPVEGGFDYSGPAALRAIVESAKLASRVAETGDVSEIAGRPLVNAIGALTGLPTRAVLQVADGWEQMQEGADGVDGLRTVLFGKPLKDPR